MLIKKRTLLLSTVGLGTLMLVGCAGNGFISTKTMAAPQVILPVQATQGKNIYVQVNNVTGQSLNLLQPLDQALQNNGYTVVADIMHADQVLSVDVLQVGKNTMTNVKAAAASGVGGAVAGEHVNPAALLSDNDLRVLVTNAYTQNLTYSLIADVKFSYKIASNSFQIQNQNAPVNPAGAAVPATNNTSNFNVNQTNWNNYNTRVISYAVKVNLPFNQAATALSNDVVAQINSTLTQSNS